MFGQDPRIGLPPHDQDRRLDLPDPGKQPVVRRRGEPLPGRLAIALAAVSVVVIAYAWFNLTGPAAGLTAGAALVYLVGVFGVTVFFSVPLNEALAGLDATSETARQFWETRYLPRWTFWNSVRTVGSVLAVALYLFGLLWAAQG